VAVFIRPATGGDVMVDASDYAVSLAAEGGTVVFGAAPVSGDVYIVSEPSFLQSVIFASGQPFLPSVVNDVNDRDVTRALYLKREVDRAAKTPIGGGAENQFPIVKANGEWGFSSGTGNDPALRADLANPEIGAKLTAFRLLQPGAAVRDVQERLQDTVSVKDFGAVGDGFYDNTAAFQAAEAMTGDDPIYVPPGRYNAGVGFYGLLNKRYTGPGQVVLDGYAQARERSFMTSEIEDVSFDRTRIFDGDWSKAHDVRYAFRGGDLGKTPITEYRNLTLASPEIRILDFTGGINTGLEDHAGGRTGMADQRFLAYHGGQGDLVERTFFGEVYSSRAGALSWYAQPAIIVENGGLSAIGGATGAFLNHSEFIYADNGLAVNAIDRVRNYFRTNAGDSLYQVWVHDRPQSSGSVPIDAAYSPSGTFKRGFDTASATFDSGAWAATKRGEYRYMDATATADPLGGRFYSQDLGETFDGIVGDTYTLAIGAGVKYKISGLREFPDHAAAGVGGLVVGDVYINSTTGALTYKRT